MQTFKFQCLFLLCLLFSGMLWAQPRPGMEKYWIFLTDKGDVSNYAPEDILTARALARRERHGVAIAQNDYPVSAVYGQALSALGAELRHPSRWFNAYSAWMDAETRIQIAALPFVQEVKAIPSVHLDLEAIAPMPQRIGYASGFTSAQLDMIGLDQLHQNGYNGRGILISIMDNGFSKVDKNPYLKHLFDDNRILATYDFVNDETDVMNEGSHGAAVLSILAGWGEELDTEFNFYGAAHGASYILCHTEDNTQEVHQEEDNWVAAMEYADSLGADIFSTSLGYRSFDNMDDYGYAGMDGNTTIITRGADLAASKGIIVVNSAGNSGANKLLAPSDGDSVIAVGAVKADRVIASFSSHGPSFDNRIKPDVCAMGQSTAFVNTSGQLSRGNGTSFSCPVMSGFLACLLQVAPETKNMDLYQILIHSADRYTTPDEMYGYGIPSAQNAYLELTGQKLPAVVATSLLEENGFSFFPNPATNAFQIAIDNDQVGFPAILELVDTRGKVVLTQHIIIAPFYNVLRLNRADHYANLAAGRYVIRIRENKDNGVVRYTGRIVILNNR